MPALLWCWRCILLRQRLIAAAILTSWLVVQHPARRLTSADSLKLTHYRNVKDFAGSDVRVFYPWTSFIARSGGRRCCFSIWARGPVTRALQAIFESGEASGFACPTPHARYESPGSGMVVG